MDSIKKIQKTVKNTCFKHHEIITAYLFGSIADKEKKTISDVDIALLFDTSISFSSSEISAFLFSFISYLENKLKKRVDVVILNRAGEFLKYEVRKTGKLLVDKNSEKRKNFEIVSRKLYEDSLYLHNRYVNKVLYGGENG